MKKPTLLEDWRWIVRHAWSFRLNVLAGLFAAAEAILPLFMYDFPRGVFAGLTLVTVICSNIVRLIAQRNGQ